MASHLPLFIFAFKLPFLKLFKTSLFGSHTFLNIEARNGKDNVLFTCYSPFSHCGFNKRVKTTNM